MADVPQDVKASSPEPGCARLEWKAPATGTPKAYEVLAQPTMTLHTVPVAEHVVDGQERPFDLCGLEAGATYSFTVATVDASGRSAAVAADPAMVTIMAGEAKRTWQYTSYGLAALTLVAGAVVRALHWTHHTRVSVSWALVVMAIALFALSATGGRFGLWRAVVGADRRVSTSRLTTGLWTLVVGFALLYMTFRTWLYHDQGLFDGLIPGGDTGAGKADRTQIWDDYLVLLGGPFAALVTVRGLVTTKQQDQVLQKTVGDDGSASLKQALTNDADDVDLVDSQYLLFNIVALTYVVVGLATTTRLPSIPAILLALTGSSAATYVLNKAVQNQAPTVSSVVPSSFRPGERITISGANLLPAGPQRPPQVTIGGQVAIVEAPATDGRVTAIVPPGVAAGACDLVVTTAARAATEPKRVSVLADQPQVLAVIPPAPVAGTKAKVQGLGFTTALDPVPLATVLIGGAPAGSPPVTTLPSGLQELEVIVPAGQAAGTAAVAVRTARQVTSPDFPVTFAAAS